MGKRLYLILESDTRTKGGSKCRVSCFLNR